MRLSDYIKKTRKEQYKSAGEFLKNTKLNIPISNYYSYENGGIVPKPDDLLIIIRTLKLNEKISFLLWLHEHLPDESIKKYFPVPSLTNSNKEDIARIYRLEETSTVCPVHVGYLLENYLARNLLVFFFVNAASSMELEYLYKEFSKHNKQSILKEIKKLIEMGYVRENGKHLYSACSKYLYIPKTNEFEQLRKLSAIDMIENSDIKNEQYTEYGKYNKGAFGIFNRTLTPEQLDHATSLFLSAFSEVQTIPSYAGQEYNICFLVGAFKERK